MIDEIILLVYWYPFMLVHRNWNILCISFVEALKENVNMTCFNYIISNLYETYVAIVV